MTHQTRPDPAHVDEDAGNWLHNASVDELALNLEQIGADIRRLTQYRDRINQELWRRAQEARPEVETSGTAVLAGDRVSMTVGADREWTYNEPALMSLQTLCRCGRQWEQHELRTSGSRVCSTEAAYLAERDVDPADFYKPILTEEEYSGLVTWIAKVNGTAYNSLKRRGGALAAALEACRTLKSARPTIGVKERS